MSHSVPAAKPRPIALIVGAVLLAIGAGAVAFQLAEGLVVSNIYPFGLYLAAFFCFAGGACGLLLIAAAAELGLFADFGTTRPLYAGALSLLVAAGCTITFFDCGQPLRVFSMIAGTNPTSMVSWDFYFLVATTVIAVIGLFKPGKATAVIGSLCALGIVVIEAMILIVTSGVPHWNNPMIVLMFLVDALTIGLSLVLLARGRSSRGSAVALGSMLALTLIMLLSDTASGLYTGDFSMTTLITGPFAPAFWIMLAAGVTAPLVLVVASGGNGRLAQIAAALAIAGVFLDKLTLLLAGQALTATGELAPYAIAPVEFAGVAGGVGLALVLFSIINRAITEPRRAEEPVDESIAVSQA